MMSTKAGTPSASSWSVREMPYRTTERSRFLWRSSDTTSSFGIPRSTPGSNLMIAQFTVIHARRRVKACGEAGRQAKIATGAFRLTKPFGLWPSGDVSLGGQVDGRLVAFGQHGRSATVRPRACRLQQWQRREERKRKHLLGPHVSDANLCSKGLERRSMTTERGKHRSPLLAKSALHDQRHE